MTQKCSSGFVRQHTAFSMDPMASRRQSKLYVIWLHGQQWMLISTHLSNDFTSVYSPRVARKFNIFLKQQEHSKKCGRASLLWFPVDWGVRLRLQLHPDSQKWFSGYDFFRLCTKADAKKTLKALVKYFTTFVPIPKSFCDQSSHHCNDVMDPLAAIMGVRYHFSAAYVPMSDDTANSFCKELLRLLHLLSTELRIQETKWLTVLTSLQSIINHSSTQN